MAENMPEPPRRIIGHVLAGDRERALNSESIWYCASCFTCAVRCPQGISITDVMYALRSLAAPTHKNVSTVFYKTFTDSVVAGGKAHEAGVAMAAGFARGPGALLGLAPMGLGLMAKGRMHLAKPAPIKGTGELAALAKAVQARRPQPVVRPVREEEH
jgi:heterodisulfide reductase subunit C